MNISIKMVEMSLQNFHHFEVASIGLEWTWYHPKFPFVESKAPPKNGYIMLPLYYFYIIIKPYIANYQNPLSN